MQFSVTEAIYLSEDYSRSLAQVLAPSQVKHHTCYRNEYNFINNSRENKIKPKENACFDQRNPVKFSKFHSKLKKQHSSFLISNRLYQNTAERKKKAYFINIAVASQPLLLQ